MIIDSNNLILKAFWFLALLGITLFMATNLSYSPSALHYGLWAGGIILGGYLTGLLGVLTYTVAHSGGVDQALRKMGTLEKFVDALAEPFPWADKAFWFTGLYFISLLWNWPLLHGALLCISVSFLATTVICIIRNFHLIRAFLRLTIKGVLIESAIRELVSHIMSSEADKECDKEGCNCKIPPEEES